MSGIPMDRTANWSEGHGFTDDVMHNLGAGGEQDLDAGALVVRKGVILLSDCPRCGRQNKTILYWAEIAAWEMKRCGAKDQRGQPLKWNPDFEQPTRQGLMIAILCNGTECGRSPFKVMLDWDDLRKWVDVGVQSGCLSAKLYELRRR